jgi:hypothetical protein
MPYIKEDEREKYDNIVNLILELSGNEITGKLNYILYKLAKEYCIIYEDYRNFIGELESAKLEIYRRLVARYENQKIKENGDIN